MGAPLILVNFSGDWDVHWGLTGVLTHGHPSDLRMPVPCQAQLLQAAQLQAQLQASGLRWAVFVFCSSNWWLGWVVSGLEPLLVEDALPPTDVALGRGYLEDHFPLQGTPCQVPC